MQSGTIDTIDTVISPPIEEGVDKEDTSFIHFEVILEKILRLDNAEAIRDKLEKYARDRLKVKEWSDPYDVAFPLFLSVVT